MGGVSTILQANNKTRVAKAEYRAAVAQTKNTNTLQAGKSSLDNFMRSFGNKVKLEQAGKEYNYQMEVLSEELRAASGGNLNVQLQLAAARGALTAQSGAAGVGGSSADLMDTMVRLQAEMDQESRDNAQELLASRGGKQTAQIMSKALGSIDLTQTFGQYDYSQYIEPERMKRRFGKLIGVAAATWLGGPQAGEAAADAMVGTWQASNGDFDGSGQSFAAAAQGALQAYKQWGQRDGQTWGSAVMEGWGKGGEQSTDWGPFAPNQGSTNYSTETSGLGWFGNG